MWPGPSTQVPSLLRTSRWGIPPHPTPPLHWRNGWPQLSLRSIEPADPPSSHRHVRPIQKHCNTEMFSTRRPTAAGLGGQPGQPSESQRARHKCKGQRVLAMVAKGFQEAVNKAQGHQDQHSG